MMMLTLARLKELLHYDPETGVFTRLVDINNRTKAGMRAGYQSPDGYRVICIDREDHRENRLAWFYMTGEWPKGEVDHRNHVTSDNRWSNLRDATISQNRRNARLRHDSSSGIKGVSWVKKDKVWRARLYHEGKEKVVGYFKDIQAAKSAIEAAREMFHGEFACHGGQRG